MVDTKEIYVSFKRNSYRSQKANVLHSQISFIECMKRLQNLSKLSTEKAVLHDRVEKLLEQVSEHLTKFDEALPSPAIPKSISEPKVAKSPLEIEMKKPRGPTGIEAELLEIKRKLAELNA